MVSRYNKLLADWPEFTLPELPDYECQVSWYIYAPIINLDAAKMDRDKFIEHMKEHNIGIGYHHHAVHLYTYYKNNFGFKKGDFPHAETISDRILSLPLFTDMTIEDQDRVINAMKKVFRK